MLGVIGGWIVGILTPTIQRAIDKWFALRDDRVALLTYVARDVLPSLRTMDEQLEAYLRSGAPEGWSISEALYLGMAMPDAPVHRILPKDQRERYLGPFKTLHEQIVTFNREHGFHHDEKARKAAKRARRSIDALLGRAETDLPEPPEDIA